MIPETADARSIRDNAWIERYLALLGIERRAPSLEALTEIVRAHLLTVPFENITATLRRADCPEGRVPAPDLGSLLESWEQTGSGGVCFELAGMAHALLRSIGYHAWPVLGHISFPGSHGAVVVDLDGARYLVDVGNGAPILQPVPLDRVTELRWGQLAYRFRPGDDEDWVQERLIDGEWTYFCHYGLRPATLEERDSGYQRHHQVGGTWVVDSLRLVRVREDELLSLRDDTLTHFTLTGKTVELLTDPVDYAALTARFGLPNLPIAEATRRRILPAVTAST